jgi:hypothetical protein
MHGEREGIKMLLDPSHPDAPKYWIYEMSGVLVPAVEAYFNRESMTTMQVAAMRAYLRQWIMSPVWDAHTPEAALALLRAGINQLQGREDIDWWLKIALAECIDPL